MPLIFVYHTQFLSVYILLNFVIYVTSYLIADCIHVLWYVVKRCQLVTSYLIAECSINVLWYVAVPLLSNHMIFCSFFFLSSNTEARIFYICFASYEVVVYFYLNFFCLVYFILVCGSNKVKLACKTHGINLLSSWNSYKAVTSVIFSCPPTLPLSSHFLCEPSGRRRIVFRHSWPDRWTHHVSQQQSLQFDSGITYLLWYMGHRLPSCHDSRTWV